MCYQKQEQQYSNAKKKKLILQAERTMTCCSFIEHNNLVFNPPPKKTSSCSFFNGFFFTGFFFTGFFNGFFIRPQPHSNYIFKQLVTTIYNANTWFFLDFFFLPKLQSTGSTAAAHGWRIKQQLFLLFLFIFCFENCPKETFGSIAAVGKKDTAE